jgi:hypothetical protein
VKWPTTLLGRIAVLFGVVLVIGVAAALAPGGSNDDAGCSDRETATTAVAERGPEAVISVVEARSFCDVYPWDASVKFVVTLTNESDVDGEADVTPVRRYSDASVNDSFTDTMSIAVPARQTRTVFHLYDYKASEHDLLRCWARVEGSGEDVEIAVNHN